MDILSVTGIFTFLLFAGLIVFIVWYLKAFSASRSKNQKKAEEQRKRHGGESVLEWSGSFANGEPDTEFGRLVVVIPKKRGDDAARFYEKGLVVNNKRLPYSEIKNIGYSASSSEKKYTLKQLVRDSGVMWIYPQKGSVIGIREMSYQFHNETMENIKKGLGFSL